jgi:hypothetical protein
VNWRRLAVKAVCAIGIICVPAWISGCGGSTTGPSQQYPSGFETFQEAAVIFGQADGTGSIPNGGAGAVNGAGLSSPFGSMTAGAFYVPDQGNRRILGFTTFPTTDGQSAAFAVGQPDLTAAESGVSASRFGAIDCDVDGNKLFSVDLENNRVLIWNTLPTGDVPADLVVGQSSFTSNSAATSQSGLNDPVRVRAAGSKLFVLEYSNNRCLIWNTVPTTNGAPADVVVGQPGFTTNTPNLSQTGFSAVRGLWTDGQRLMIAGNRRVLIWNQIPTTNNAPADVVVGADDFTTLPTPNPETGIGEPWGVASDGTALFVADVGFQRVLIYDAIPTENGALPDRILGQSTLNNVTPNDDDQDGNQDATPSRRVVRSPVGVSVVGRNLVVADQGNHRLLVFEP